jgi:hypothetical protein
MKTLYLAQVGRQLFAVDKERVVGVGMCSDDKPMEAEGGRYLILPRGIRAVICDMQTLMTGYGRVVTPKRHYLIVSHDSQLMGLTMSGKGRIITADVAAASPLPPAFVGQARALVPGVLVNGIDLILLLDLQAVLETTVGQHREPDAECKSTS